jgi:hypothetical protein
MSTDTHWKTTNATVISSDFHYARLRDLDLENEPFLDKSFYVVRFRYEVGSEEFFGALELHDPLNNGEQLSISYDPDNPAANSAATPKVPRGRRLMVSIVGIALTAVLVYFMEKFGLSSN